MKCLWLLVFWFPALVLVGRVPEEIESVGGQGLSYGNAGVALPTSSTSTVRTNPALMSLSRHYILSANYHFPSYDRDFYQVGVVDSVSSQVAVGLQMSSYMDEDVSQRFNSPLKRRYQGGMSFPLGQLAIGVSGQWIEWNQGLKLNSKKTFGLGAATTMGSWVLGLSGENLKNEGVEFLAPRVLRAGVSWQQYALVLGAELQQRDRVPQESPTRLVSLRIPNVSQPPEKLGTIYGGLKLWNVLTTSAAYSRSIDGVRQSASAGMVLDQKTFQVFWNAQLPELESPVHYSMGINLNIRV